MATPAGRTEPVSFREEPATLEKVDRLAGIRGTDRTAIYREAVRYYLGSDRLTDQEKKALGVATVQQ